MTREDFVCWLQGFIAGLAGAEPTHAQWDLLLANLSKAKNNEQTSGNP